MKSKYLLPFCWLVLLCSPAVSICLNQQINRLVIVAVLLLLVGKSHSIKWLPHHFLFLGWLAWVTLGTLYSNYPDLAFYGFYPYRGEGLLAWIVITCIAFLYWQNFDSLKPLAYVSLIGMILLISAKLFIVHPNKEIFLQKLFMPDVGLASFLCQSSILLGGFNPWLIVIGFLPLLSCASRSGVMALGAFGLVYFLYCQRKSIKTSHIVILCVIVAFMGLWTFNSTGMMHQKAKSTLNTLKSGGLGARTHWILEADFLDHQLPLTGYGLDTLSEYLTAPKVGGFALLDFYYLDRTHNLIYDLILMTGWIGYTLLLLCLGYAIALVIKYPIKHNVLCICVVGAYLIHGMANPHGVLGHITCLTCLLGIRKI